MFHCSRISLCYGFCITQQQLFIDDDATMPQGLDQLFVSTEMRSGRETVMLAGAQLTLCLFPDAGRRMVNNDVMTENCSIECRYNMVLGVDHCIVCPYPLPSHSKIKLLQFDFNADQEDIALE